MSEIMNEQAVPIPEPVKKEMEEEINITADTITEEIIGVGDDGYSRSDIIMLIEKIHNVLKNPENITEDDHEYVKQIDVEYCKVDIFSINDSNFSLAFIIFPRLQVHYIKLLLICLFLFFATLDQGRFVNIL